MAAIEALRTNKPNLARKVQASQVSISEIQSPYVLMNKTLINQHLKIIKGALRIYKETGAVPIGQSNLPFDSADLCVDIHNNSLVLGNLGLNVPNNPMLWVGGRAIEIATLEFFKLLHKIHSNTLVDPTTKDQVDQSPGIAQFNEGFAEAVAAFDREGMDYRILGSFGLAASINRAGGDFYLTPRRANGVRRDADFVLLNGDPRRAKQLVTSLNTRQKAAPYYPEISLNIAKPFEVGENVTDHRARYLPFVVTSVAKDGRDNIHLTFNESSVPLPGEYMEPSYAEYAGTRFPTLQSEVLAGFYLTRMAIYKSKDVEKVTQMLRLSTKPIPPEFINFAQELRVKYPDLYRNGLMREMLYHFSGGTIRTGSIASAKALLGIKTNH